MGTNLAVKTELQRHYVTCYLNPRNEGHEIPYAESFKGSAFDAVCRARKIIDGLSAVLPRGSWSIEIEQLGTWDKVYVNDLGLFDSDWNEIAGFGN
jgi:hypothetical protein